MDAGVVAGKNKRRLPVESIAGAPRGAGADETPLAGAQVEPRHRPALALGINLIGIVGIDPADESITAVDELPVAVDRAAPGNGPGCAPDPGPRATGATPASVVLQTAIHAVISSRTDGDMVELSDGELVEVLPIFATVIGHIVPAVIAQQNMATIVRIDPHGMMIDVYTASRAVRGEGLPAIL